MTAIKKILCNLERGLDGIYSLPFSNSDQQPEIELREQVASVEYNDYLREIAK